MYIIPTAKMVIVHGCQSEENKLTLQCNNLKIKKNVSQRKKQRLGRGSSNSSRRSDSYPHPHLGGQLEEIEVPCSLKSPARSLKTIFLRLPAGFFVFRVL